MASLSILYNYGRKITEELMVLRCGHTEDAQDVVNGNYTNEPVLTELGVPKATHHMLSANSVARRMTAWEITV